MPQSFVGSARLSLFSRIRPSDSGTPIIPNAETVFARYYLPKSKAVHCKMSQKKQLCPQWYHMAKIVVVSFS